MLSRAMVLHGITDSITIRKVFKDDNDEYEGLFDKDYEFFDDANFNISDVRDTLSDELEGIGNLCLIVTISNLSLPAITGILSYCRYNNINVNIVYYDEKEDTCLYQPVTNYDWYKMLS
jgi:hypothetical protein